MFECKFCVKIVVPRVLFPAADSIPRLTAPVLGFFGNNSARTFSHHDPFLGWAVGAMAHTLVYACSVRACRTAADVLSSVCLRSLPLCPILLQPRLINRWLAAALADYSVRPLLPAPCLLSVMHASERLWRRRPVVHTTHVLTHPRMV